MVSSNTIVLLDDCQGAWCWLGMYDALLLLTSRYVRDSSCLDVLCAEQLIYGFRPTPFSHKVYPCLLGGSAVLDLQAIAPPFNDLILHVLSGIQAGWIGVWVLKYCVHGPPPQPMAEAEN